MGLTKGLGSSLKTLAVWGTILGASAVITACNKSKNEPPRNTGQVTVAAVPQPPTVQCLSYYPSGVQQQQPGWEPYGRCEIQPYRWGSREVVRGEGRHRRHSFNSSVTLEFDNNNSNKKVHPPTPPPVQQPDDQSSDEACYNNYGDEIDCNMQDQDGNVHHHPGNRFPGVDSPDDQNQQFPPPPQVPPGQYPPQPPMTPQPVPFPQQGLCGCPAGMVPACTPNLGLTCVPVQYPNMQIATWGYQNNEFSQAPGPLNPNPYQRNSCASSVAQVCLHPGDQAGEMYCQQLSAGGYGIWVYRR